MMPSHCKDLNTLGRSFAALSAPDTIEAQSPELGQYVCKLLWQLSCDVTGEWLLPSRRKVCDSSASFPFLSKRRPLQPCVSMLHKKRAPGSLFRVQYLPYWAGNMHMRNSENRHTISVLSDLLAGTMTRPAREGLRQLCLCSLASEKQDPSVKYLLGHLGLLWEGHCDDCGQTP